MDTVTQLAITRARAALNIAGRPLFNFARAIDAVKDHGMSTVQLAGFEGERSREISRRYNKAPQPSRFFVEADDLAPYAMRADTVATAATGGYLVETMNVGYIELARPRSIVATFGATVVEGLKGNAALPRVTSSVTVGGMPVETTAVADSTHGLGQVNLTAKELATSVKVSRTLLEQETPAASALIVNDMLAEVGKAVDVLALAGTGVAGQPTGITNIAGIGSVSGTSINRSGVIDLQGAVGNRLNASGGYAAPIATAKTLSKRLSDGSNLATYVWEGGLYDGMVAGERAIASDNVPASTLVYGSWDQLLLASWGPLEIEVSPFGTSAADFQAGIVALRIIFPFDVGVRDPKAFAAATGVT